MIRFTSLDPVSSGIPYVTDDFTSILQQEHIKSYSAFLDGINFGSTSSTLPLNNGIILSGCEIVSTTPTQFVMNFTSSVVYIDGEFYQWDPNVSVSPTINFANFFLIAGPTVSELRTLPTPTLTTTTASHTRYFTTTTVTPTVPHIRFSNRGTSRYYKRILKYFTSRVGDVYITKDKSNFDNNGVGFNSMEGFVILDSNSGVPNTPNLNGRFLRVWGSGYSLGAFGGSHSHRITPFQMPTHNHPLLQASYNGEPANMTHYHYINTSRFKSDLNDTPINTELSEAMDPDQPTQFNPDQANENTGSLFARHQNPPGYSTQPHFTGGVRNLENSELQTHTHNILQSDFGDGNPSNPGTEHENRPPYYVVVYYTKKPN